MFSHACLGLSILKQLWVHDCDWLCCVWCSPYRRSSQTTEGIASCFAEAQIAGFQEEVQLREQDFGNFQVGATCSPWE